MPDGLLQVIAAAVVTALGTIAGTRFVVRRELEKHRATRSYDRRVAWMEETARRSQALFNMTTKVMVHGQKEALPQELIDEHQDAIDAFLTEVSLVDAFADPEAARAVREQLDRFSHLTGRFAERAHSGMERREVYRSQVEFLPVLKRVHDILVDALSRM